MSHLKLIIGIYKYNQHPWMSQKNKLFIITRRFLKQSALAQHFHDAKDHDPEKDMSILILQTGLSTEAEREYHEDRWICRLQTMEPTGINKERHQYGHDMYVPFTKTL